MPDFSEHREQVEGVDTFWRRSESDGGGVPTLFVHGVPTSSDDWLPFLARADGVALDLPGFGRSGKPADFDYSIAGYDRFLESFLDAAGIERFSLLVHDWGAVALATAQRCNERLDRLVLIAAVPLLEGYEWHRIARIWRRPVLGELAMGFATRRSLKQISKEANVTPGPLPEELLDSVWSHFDHGTQRAILRLYRSATPQVLAAAGSDLARIDCPSLVLWPDSDPYIGTQFGPAYAQALGGRTTFETVHDAGHWAWLDRPELIDRVAGFLAAGPR